MSYVTDLKNEAQSNFLARIAARNNTCSFTTVGSNEVANFTLGIPVNVYRADTGATLIKETSIASLGSGEYFYDPDTKDIYIPTSTHGGDDSQIVIEYEMYFGTNDAYAPRDPTTSGDDVYWEPLLKSVPDIEISTNDGEQGVLSSTTSSVVVSNGTKFFDPHFNNSFFRRSKVFVYHWITLKGVHNYKLTFTGFIDSVSITDSDITFSVFDNLIKLEKEFTRGDGIDEYTTSLYAFVDPAFLNTKIKSVHGFTENLELVNVDYAADIGTLGQSKAVGRSRNRQFAICKHFGALITSSDLVSTITAVMGGGYTFSLASTDGFNVGDRIKLSSDAFDGKIVSKTSTQITLEFPRTMSVGATVTRGRLAGLTVYDTELKTFLDESLTTASYVLTADNVLLVSFPTNWESTTSFHDFADPLNTTTVASEAYHFDPKRHKLFARVYGEYETTTISGVQFSNRSSLYGVTSKWYEILYSYLRYYVGFAESEIDTAKFLSIRSSDTGQEMNLAYTIPASSGDGFPTHRSHIAQIMGNIIGRIYLTFDGKISVERASEYGSSDHLVDQDDIIDGTFSYSIEGANFNSKVEVLYNNSDFKRTLNNQVVPYDKTTLSSNVLKQLNGNEDVVRSYTILSSSSSDATLAKTRFLKYNGYQRIDISFDLGLDFFDVDVSDVIELTRDSVFGFDYVFGNRNTIKIKVIGVKRSRNKVSIKAYYEQGPQIFPGDF